MLNANWGWNSKWRNSLLPGKIGRSRQNETDKWTYRNYWDVLAPHSKYDPTDDPWCLIKKKAYSPTCYHICNLYMYAMGMEKDFPTKMLRRQMMKPTKGYTAKNEVMVTGTLTVGPQEKAGRTSECDKPVCNTSDKILGR